MKGIFRLRGFLLVVLIVGAIAGGWFLRSGSQPRSHAEHPGEARNVVVPSPNVHGAIATAATNSPRPSRRMENSTGEDGGPSVTIFSDRPRFVSETSSSQRKMAEADAQLRMAAGSLRDYKMAFHQNPVGSNAEITRVLLGKNSRGVRYLPAAAHINEKGELTDRWDQPISFHQISGTIMEVRSAGPDHIMWNSDDEALR